MTLVKWLGYYLIRWHAYVSSSWLVRSGSKCGRTAPLRRNECRNQKQYGGCFHGCCRGNLVCRIAADPDSQYRHDGLYFLLFIWRNTFEVRCDPLADKRGSFRLGRTSSYRFNIHDRSDGFSFLGHYFADIYKPGKDHQPKRYRRDQNRKPFVELLM